MITVSVDRSKETLNVNGVQIYPPQRRLPDPIFAPQVQSEVSLVDFKTANNNQEGGQSPFKPLRLGYNAVVRTVSDAALTDGSQVMELELKVLRIENKDVYGADKIKTTFFKGPEGDLFISRVEVVPDPFNAQPAIHCTGWPLLCRLKAVVTTRIIPKFRKAFRGCHKLRMHMRPAGKHHLAHMPHNHAQAKHQEKPQHLDVPQHLDIPHLLEQAPPAEEPVHRHHFTHTLRRVVIHVLVPVFVGIAVGMMVSLVGMVIGQLVVMLWRRFYRNKSRYTNVPQSDETTEHDEDSEEKRLLSEDELPVYQDVEAVLTAEKN